MSELNTAATPRARRRVGLLDVQVEFASHLDNALFLALLLAIVAGLAATGLRWRDPLWLGFGLLCFLPQEYFTHVLLLHRKLPRTQRVYLWFYRLHYGHHDFPRRHDLMYMPAWLTVPMMAANALALWLLTPDARAFAAAYGGAVLGYMVFEFSHLLCHVPYVPQSRLFKHVRTLHLLHHFSDEKTGYAVAPWSLFIDRLMGTAIDRDTAEAADRSPTCRHLGLPATHPWLEAARAKFADRSNGDATGSRLWLVTIPQARLRSLPPEGAVRQRPGEAGSAAGSSVNSKESRRQASRAALALPAHLGAEIERLCTPDGRAFAGYTALYLAAWAVGVALLVAVPMHAGWKLLLSACLGSQLHALTVLQHDCGHRSAFRSAAANLWVGRALAWFVFMPFTTFTELHRRHHGFLGDAQQDPDEWFYEGGARQVFLRECLFMPRFIVLSLQRLSGEVRRRIVRELVFNAVTHAALIVALLASGQVELLLWAYALPMLWLALVFNPISRGYEHYPMASLHAGDSRRGDLRDNTISVTSRFVGVAWAWIGLHVEHHMYPRVPFHRLPALHRLFSDKAYRHAPWPLHDLAGHRAGAAIHVTHACSERAGS